MHGGSSPVGLANGNFRHGRYSRAIPARLFERFAIGASDPELLSLRNEIALVDARIEDVLGRVDCGEAGCLWRDLRAAYVRMTKAQAGGDIAAGSQALVEIGGLIQRGAADDAAWDDLGRWIEKRRKLTESEAKRLVALRLVITAEEAMALIAALEAIVKKHVSDRQALRAIAADLYELARREAAHEPWMSTAQI